MSPTSTENWLVESISGALEPSLVAQIAALAAAAEEEDGNPPLSEQTLIELRRPTADPDSVLTLVAYAATESTEPVLNEDLAGFGVVLSKAGEGVLEMVVDPHYRNQGVGVLLAEKLRSVRGLAGLKAWSHGNSEAAAELAARFGYTPVRELWRMRLTRQAETDPATVELPAAELPADIEIRTFVPGKDEQAWLRANAAAFAHHPEQGAMTLADLQARMAEPWFDPSGFFLAVRPTEPTNILGFHWTKVHPAQAGHPTVGEVYAVGVTPEAQGGGLGKALTIAGVRHLHEAGLQAIMLYVDADNTAAVALYRRLGFTRWDTDVMYAPATS